MRNRAPCSHLGWREINGHLWDASVYPSPTQWLLSSTVHAGANEIPGRDTPLVGPISVVLRTRSSPFKFHARVRWIDRTGLNDITAENPARVVPVIVGGEQHRFPDLLRLPG